MTARRDFLRSLAALPLIGGGVTLIGKPTGVAEPATRNLLENYKTWLHYEHRALAWEMAELPDVVAWYGGTRRSRSESLGRCHVVDNGGGSFHRFDAIDPAAGRAALVLSTVGCSWQEAS